MTPAELMTGHLLIDTPMGGSLSNTRVRLLEAIDQFGSINQAAKAVPLSYRAAWDAVDSMNNLSPEPLVVRVTGGRQGGGTLLTVHGQRVVAMYRALELETRASLARAARYLADGGPYSIDDFRRLVRRISWKTSARNQFFGPIAALHHGAIDCEVRLRLDSKTEIAAIITRISAENLELETGKEVIALVKSSSVSLSIDAQPNPPVFNQLWGKVGVIREGPVNDEVTLHLPVGKSVTAIVTHEDRVNLELREGSRACALFRLSSVILASPD